MKRTILALVMLAVSAVFAATVPSTAVAGLKAVPAVAADAGFDSCTGENVPAALVVLVCGKKAVNLAVPCPDVHAITPFEPGGTARPAAGPREAAGTSLLADADRKGPLRPPRG